MCSYIEKRRAFLSGEMAALRSSGFSMKVPENREVVFNARWDFEVPILRNTKEGFCAQKTKGRSQASKVKDEEINKGMQVLRYLIVSEMSHGLAYLVAA